MKKLLLKLSIILLGVYILLTLLDMGSDYRAERSLWMIGRQVFQMTQHEETTPEYAIEKVAGQYQRFIKKYGNHRLAVRAQHFLGNLYMFHKDFPRAREEYKKVLTMSKDKEILSEAMLGIARTYEQQNDANNALAIYKDIVKKYPMTSTGFGLPIYICNFYELKGMRAEADASYEEAAGFYRDVASKYPKSAFEYNALRSEAICRLAQKHWRQAVVVMGQLMNKYPGNAVALKESMNTINTICVVQLHDYFLAISIYNEFITKYPKHPAVPVVKKMIKQFEILKNKGIRVNKDKPSDS